MDLSASKLTLYQQCPAQYRARYVVPSNERGVEVSRGSADAGNVVHRVLHLAALKRIGKQEKEPVTFKELESLLQVAITEPKEGWKEPPTLSAEVIERATEILKKSWKKIDLTKAVMAEKEFSIPIGPIGGPTGRESNEILNLKGVFDLVNDREDRIRIVDYKTGYDVMSAQEAELDPQVNFYLEAGHRLFPGRKVEIEFHYLVRGFRLGPIEWSEARSAWILGLCRAAAYRITKWSYWREQPNPYCVTCVRQKECKTFQRTLKGQLGDVILPIGESIAEYKRLGDLGKNVEGRRKVLKEVINKALETAEDGEILHGSYRARTIFTSRWEFNDFKRTTSVAAKLAYEHEVASRPVALPPEIPSDPVELRAAHEAALKKIAALEEATKKLQMSYTIACEIGKAEKGRVDAFVESLPKDLGMKIAQVVEPTGSNAGYYRLDVEEMPDPFLSAEPTEEEAKEIEEAAKASRPQVSKPLPKPSEAAA